VPKGGPDGGDGGDGGHVYVQINPQLYNLDHINPRRKYRAKAGEPGSNQKKHGKKGEDLVISVPPGVVIHDTATGELLLDAASEDFQEEQVLLCRGGKGGLGNVHFANSVNQAPDYAQPGLAGEEKEITIDLKLIADIGFVGLPNAGKSTLLSQLTNAKPKIGDYPFTTLIPQLGTLTVETERGPQILKLADIPGIIEGAHKGSGLGISFLQHIERVRLIFYLLGLDNRDPVYTMKILRQELHSYSAALVAKPALLVFNKWDLIPLEEREETKKLYRSELEGAFSEIRGHILFLSAKTGEGVAELHDHLADMVADNTLAGN
jgi:GTP-binding protein